MAQLKVNPGHPAFGAKTPLKTNPGSPDFTPPPIPTIQDNGGTAIPAQTTGPSGQTAPDTAAPPRPTTSPVITQRDVKKPVSTSTSRPAPTSPHRLLTLPPTAEIEASNRRLVELTEGVARPNYNPDVDGIPTNVAEAQFASFWLRVNKQNNPGYIDPVTGEAVGIPTETDPETGEQVPVLDPITGQPIVTDELIQKLEFRGQVEAQIEQIYTEQRVLQAETATNNADEAAASRTAQIEFERDARIAEIEQGIDQGTPEQRAAQRDEANAQFDDALKFIEEERNEDTSTIETLLNLSTRLSERRVEFDTDIRDIGAENARIDAFLGRALEALDLDEAARASRAIEENNTRITNLAESQFKLDILTTFAQSPELIFFMGKQGTLGLFEGLLGEGDTALEDMFTRLNERPTTNIQEFMRLTGEEQGQEAFRFSALTGASDVPQTLLNQAPSDVGATRNRIRLGR